MFTGIIEEVGRIRSFSRQGEAFSLEIEGDRILQGTKLGDSIAVNGTCLTVTRFGHKSFFADVMPETVKRTNLSRLSPGSPVNLERALAVGDRLGGHLLSGHVDGVGTIAGWKETANAVLIEIAAPEELLAYIVPKGSIGVDGISLTVVEVSERGFSVSIIPHTLQATNLKYRKVNDAVNLECDLIAKYLEKLLSARLFKPENKGGLTLDFLAKHGFA